MRTCCNFRRCSNNLHLLSQLQHHRRCRQQCESAAPFLSNQETIERSIGFRSRSVLFFSKFFLICPFLLQIEQLASFHAADLVLLPVTTRVSSFLLKTYLRSLVNILTTRLHHHHVAIQLPHPKSIPFRSALYVGLGLSFVIPITHGIALFGFHTQLWCMSLDWVVLMATFNLVEGSDQCGGLAQAVVSAST